jgi:Bacterial type II and III secretion system protein/FG-GAP-like repeat
MPLLWRLEKKSKTSQANRRGSTAIALILAACWALAFVICPSGYAFVTSHPQDQAPPYPQAAPKKQTKTPANPALAQPGSFPASQADQKKAKEAYKRGLKSEAAGDWLGAFDAYSVAVDFDATVTPYGVHQAIARGHVVEAKIDAAEKAAVSGDLTTALHSLREARELDPSNKILAERLAQMEGLRPNGGPQQASQLQFAQPPQLHHLAGAQSFQIQGQTQSAYEQIAKKFGVEVAFDVELRQVPVHFELKDVDFVTAMRIMGEATDTFWRPLTSHLFFVAQDTAQKRKDYDVSIARTVLLPNSETQEQMTEITRLIREVAGITRTDLDSKSRTITMRASPQAMAVATGIIDDLEKPTSELVLEIEVIEVDKDHERNLGIVGPQSAHLYSIPTNVVSELTDGTTSFATIVTQVFGTSSLPAFLAFGGGLSTFLYTLPDTVLNFSNFLSTVRSGRRMVLRVEDGHPATFFLGERFPVSLAQFSSSLGSSAGTSIPGAAASLSAADLGISFLSTGNNPDYVATADLNGDGFQDVIVANFTDGTLSIFLGVGDGTFDLPRTVAVGAGPVWIVTGNFHQSSTTDSSTNVDIIVANQKTNSLSVLLGNGDGTFQAPTAVVTGNAPSSIAVADFNGDGISDLAIVNQGDNTIGIYLGNGDGTFKAPTLLPTGAKPTSIVAAAFDSSSNAIIDLAITNFGDNTLETFIGDGKGGFSAGTTYATGVAPIYVASADVNADQILDLIVADSGTVATGTNSVINSVSVFIGNGDGTFGTNTALRFDYPVGTNPTSIAIADFNSDGLPDMAVAAQGDNALAVLIGTGNGTFSPPFELPLQASPDSVATADFNGDGLPDVVVSNFGSNTAAIVLDSAALFGASTGAEGTQFPNAEYIDIGLKVKATPRLHPDSEVSLQLEFTLSSLAGQSLNNIPIVDNQEIHQTVRVQMDQPTFLAGYVSPQHSTSANGEPGLSYIPIAGASTDTQNQFTQLLIMITPRLVEFSPHKEHLIYAGRGQLQGSGSLGPTIQERRGQFAPQPEQQPQQQPQPQQTPPQQVPAQTNEPGAAAPAEQAPPPAPTTQPSQQPSPENTQPPSPN